MADDAPFLPGLSPVAGKPVQVTFDAGRLTSDGGVLVLAEIERQPRDRRAPGPLPRGPAGARAGPARARRDDPLPGAADRGRLRGCQRLRCAARRSGLQDGGRPAARERRRPVLAADHVPAREPARTDRAEAHDGGDDRAVLRQLRRGAAADRARHRRYRGSGPRRPAAGAVPRPLRQPLLPADPHLRGDHRQAGRGDPAARQDAGRRRGRPRPAPRRQGHPRPLAAGGDPGARRQPLRPARGHDLVRAQPGRLRLRPRRQPGPARQGRRSGRGRGARPGPWARPRRCAASASSAMPPRAGRSSAG